MRTIKFRVWDEKYRCWDTSPVLVYPEEDNRLQGRVIQLSTGLKDKNGKEIYEGDILKVHGKLYDRDSREDEPIGNFEVTYNISYESSGFYTFWMEEHYPCEIIGNKFENPELLK